MDCRIHMVYAKVDPTSPDSEVANWSPLVGVGYVLRRWMTATALACAAQRSWHTTSYKRCLLSPHRAVSLFIWTLKRLIWASELLIWMSERPHCTPERRNWIMDRFIWTPEMLIWIPDVLIWTLGMFHWTLDFRDPKLVHVGLCACLGPFVCFACSPLIYHYYYY